MFSRAAATILAIPRAAEGIGDEAADLRSTRECLADWMISVAQSPEHQGVFEACQELDVRMLEKNASHAADCPPLAPALAAPSPGGGAPPLVSASVSASASASPSKLRSFHVATSTSGSATALVPDTASAPSETPRKRTIPPDDPATPPKCDATGQSFIEYIGERSGKLRTYVCTYARTYARTYVRTSVIAACYVHLIRLPLAGTTSGLPRYLKTLAPEVMKGICQTAQRFRDAEARHGWGEVRGGLLGGRICAVGESL